jgi:probable rRNA maturation factor
MEVEVRNLQSAPVPSVVLAAVARLAAGDAAPDGSLSIALVDDPYIQRLNERYRGHDRPTDVLAFPGDVEEGHLGDVVVSVDAARRQAEERKRPGLEELAELVAHGVLHLLGMDDASDAQRQAMLVRQAEIVARAREQRILPES